MGRHDNALGIDPSALGHDAPVAAGLHIVNRCVFENRSAGRFDSGGQPDQILGRIELGLARKSQCARGFEGQRRRRNNVSLKSQLARDSGFRFDLREQRLFARVSVSVLLFQVADNAESRIQLRICVAPARLASA